MPEFHPAGASLLHPCLGCFTAPCQVLLDCPATHSTQLRAFQTQGHIQQRPIP